MKLTPNTRLVIYVCFSLVAFAVFILVALGVMSFDDVSKGTEAVAALVSGLVAILAALNVDRG